MQIIESQGLRLFEGMPATIDTDEPACRFPLDCDGENTVAATHIADISWRTEMLQHIAQHRREIVVVWILLDLVNIAVREVRSNFLSHVRCAFSMADLSSIWLDFTKLLAMDLIHLSQAR